MTPIPTNLEEGLIMKQEKGDFPGTDYKGCQIALQFSEQPLPWTLPSELTGKTVRPRKMLAKCLSFKSSMDIQFINRFKFYGNSHKNHMGLLIHIIYVDRVLNNYSQNYHFLTFSFTKSENE